MREPVCVNPYEMYLIAAMLPMDNPLRISIEECLLSHPHIKEMLKAGNRRFLAYQEFLNEARSTHPELVLDSLSEALGAIFMKRNSHCSFCLTHPRGVSDACIYVPGGSEFEEGRASFAMVPKDRYHRGERHAVLPSSHVLSSYQQRQFRMVNRPLRGMVTWRIEIHGFSGSMISRLLRKGNSVSVAIEGDEGFRENFWRLEIERLGDEGIAIRLSPEQILQVLVAGTQGRRLLILHRISHLFCADFEFGFTFTIPEGPEESSPVYWAGERQFFLGGAYLLQDIPFRMAVDLVRRYPWTRCFRSYSCLNPV